MRPQEHIKILEDENTALDAEVKRLKGMIGALVGFGYSTPAMEAIVDNPNTMKWKNYRGQTKRVCDMSDAHIRNLIFYLQKLNGTVRGAITTSSPDDLYPIYNQLVDEADRRLLKWTKPPKKKPTRQIKDLPRVNPLPDDAYWFLSKFDDCF